MASSFLLNLFTLFLLSITTTTIVTVSAAPLPSSNNINNSLSPFMASNAGAEAEYGLKKRDKNPVLATRDDPTKVVSSALSLEEISEAAQGPTEALSTVEEVTQSGEFFFLPFCFFFSFFSS